MSDDQDPAASGGGHTEAADAVEAQIDGLERESEQLEEQIGETRADWESRKASEKVPGADDAGGFASPDDDGPPPETSAADGSETTGQETSADGSGSAERE